MSVIPLCQGTYCKWWQVPPCKPKVDETEIINVDLCRGTCDITVVPVTAAYKDVSAKIRVHESGLQALLPIPATFVYFIHMYKVHGLHMKCIAEDPKNSGQDGI